MSILFQADWTDDKGQLRAIPHATTKNTSFLRHCQVLKRMGIRNYAFPLALYNPELKHVDVHDLEENTPENERLRAAVMVEARHNAWYFLRECVRIYSQGGKPVPFRLDRGNCAMVWSFLNGIDYTGMQPRQAQPLDAVVRTPTGSMSMGDVVVGTEVLGPDGTTIKVVAVHPLGEREVFKVTLSNGGSTRCCKDHLWRVYSEDGFGFTYETLSLEEIVSSDKIPYIPVYNSPDNWSLETITSIDRLGVEPVQCIEVDHPDHLYITDDNIVSHNTGKTVGALSLCAWIMYVAGEDYQIGHFAKDNDLREENVKRVRAFGEFLPAWWLKEEKFKDKKNASELYYDALKTHYVTMVAQKDKGQADLKARGASTPMLHIDELEFCANIDISYPTMLASTGTARENARMNGKPHSNIITTTAGDPSRPECRAAAKILANAMPFTEHLYDVKDQAELKEIVKSSSPSQMIIGVFSHMQLGYDNEWLRDKITRNNMTKEQVLRDYLNRRVTIQDEPIIPAHTLAKITASEMDPKHIQIMSGKFVLYWYIDKSIVDSPYFKDVSIVVGGDSSEMIGRDATTLVGVDPRDLSVVFTFRANEGNLNTVGTMIAQLLLMFPKMIFVPENKSTGTGFIDSVALLLRKEGHNPFKRMFNWIVNNRHEAEFAKYDIRDTSLLDTSAKKYFGIKTDKNKRDELYSSTLLTAAAKAPNLIRDKTLIAELASLTVRNGRVDHEAGSHDDSCFIGSTLVRTKTGNRPISELKVGDLVLTRQGYKPILHIFKREKEVISRYNLTGTPDHPFITPSGEIPFEELTDDTKVYVWNEKLSCIEERNIIDTLNLRDPSIENISTGTTKTTNLLSHYIVRCGRMSTALFLLVWKFITRITTSRTTMSRISNASHQPNIVNGTRFLKKQFGKMVSALKSRTRSENGGKKIPKQPGHMPALTGRKVRVCQTGAQTILKKIGACVLKTGKRARRPTKNEVQLEKGWLTGGGTIRRRLLQSIEKLLKKQPKLDVRQALTKDLLNLYLNGNERIQNSLDNKRQKLESEAVKSGELRKEIVYNLHVAECHEYFVNDILVHNCIAWMMAVWFILNAKHLDVYGIKPGTVFSLSEPTNVTSERANEIKREKVLAKLEELQATYRRQSDISIRKLLERDIALLEKMLENVTVSSNVTGDELQRDPTKFIDHEVSRNSRRPVTGEEVTNSLASIIGRR